MLSKGKCNSNEITTLLQNIQFPHIYFQYRPAADENSAMSSF